MSEALVDKTMCIKFILNFIIHYETIFFLDRTIIQKHFFFKSASGSFSFLDDFSSLRAFSDFVSERFSALKSV